MEVIQMNVKQAAIVFGFGAVAIGTAFILPKAAFAYRGDPAVHGPYYTEERHAAMEKAFETNDYNAWKTLMQGKGRVTQVVTAENFAKFAEAHRLAEAGNTTGAQAIRQELGLGLRNGAGNGTGMGRWSK